MIGTLIIYILNISSSYAENIEQPAKNNFDVLEWWISNDGIYRIKTFSIDNDIHIHKIDRNKLQNKIESIKDNTEKHYSDVIQKVIKFEFKDNESTLEINQKLIDLNLNGKFEISSDFIFWNPDGKNYKTKTNPNKK